MKASALLNGRLEKSGSSAAATIAFNAGDVKLRASLTDATVVNGPSLKGLALAVEKPGFFIVDYNVPDKDFRFQFMNTIKIAEKPLNLTYTHSRGDNKSMLDGTLVLDSANKVSVNHIVGTGNWKLKYNYVHDGVTIFEPSYDVAKDSWDFAVSRKVYDDDEFRATYQTSTQVLGLVWSRKSKISGCLKISASVNLAEESKVPKLVAESSWNLDM